MIVIDKSANHRARLNQKLNQMVPMKPSAPVTKTRLPLKDSVMPFPSSWRKGFVLFPNRLAFRYRSKTHGSEKRKLAC
jgi:hypothetical protein